MIFAIPLRIIMGGLLLFIGGIVVGLLASLKRRCDHDTNDEELQQEIFDKLTIIKADLENTV